LKTSADPIDIQFDSNQSVSFQVGADIENAAQFGTLCIEDTYEEKYLLAYTIHGGKETYGISYVTSAASIWFEIWGVVDPG